MTIPIGVESDEQFFALVQALVEYAGPAGVVEAVAMLCSDDARRYARLSNLGIVTPAIEAQLRAAAKDLAEWEVRCLAAVGAA